MLLMGTIFGLASLGTPVLAYFLRRHVLRPGIEPLVFILACLGSYGLMLVSLPFREAGIKAHMYSFDLDSSGSFDESEMTPEATAAMQRWTSDTGRNFAPFTGVFLVPIWCGIVYSVLALCYFAVESARRNQRRGWC